MIVIHHNKDLDGFSSGAICKLKYPDATLIGWDYKDPIPDFEQFKDQDVLMIDVTFPIKRLVELAALTKSLIVMDHHISFCKDFYNHFEGTDAPATTLTEAVVQKGNIRYVYASKKAACEIGWQYLFPDQPTPIAITLLGKYDTWRGFGTHPWSAEILPFQFAMRVECTSAETFDPILLTPGSFAEDLVTKRINTGEYVVKYQEQQDMLACQRSAFEAMVGGRKAICLNTRFFSSNTMKTVYDPSKHDVMVGFEYTGVKWSVSLRSDKPDVDVSLIAKSRGGGGHKAAAGFECDEYDDIFI